MRAGLFKLLVRKAEADNKKPKARGKRKGDWKNKAKSNKKDPKKELMDLLQKSVANAIEKMMNKISQKHTMQDNNDKELMAIQEFDCPNMHDAKLNDIVKEIDYLTV